SSRIALRPRTRARNTSSSAGGRRGSCARAAATAGPGRSRPRHLPASFEKQVGSVLATIVWRVRPVAESRRRSNAGLGELTPILLTFLGETERPFLGADLRS